LALRDVAVDVLLRFLIACRKAVVPGRQGGNAYSIRDGRNAGVAIEALENWVFTHRVIPTLWATSATGRLQSSPHHVTAHAAG